MSHKEAEAFAGAFTSAGTAITIVPASAAAATEPPAGDVAAEGPPGAAAGAARAWGIGASAAAAEVADAEELEPGAANEVPAPADGAPSTSAGTAIAIVPASASGAATSRSAARRAASAACCAARNCCWRTFLARVLSCPGVRGAAEAAESAIATGR